MTSTSQAPDAATDGLRQGAPQARRVTVVTGGSHGIGLAIAKRFAELGHDLLLVARQPGPLQVASEAIGTAHGGAGRRTDWLAVDLADPDAPRAIEARLAADGAVAHILVNCAGIGISSAFAGAPVAQIEAVLALNVAAVTRLLRHFAPGMLARGGGGFLNVASLAGYVPGPYQAVYYASKAYVISLSMALAEEMSEAGVRVCVVSPGPVETRFHAEMGAEESYYRRWLPALRPETVAWVAVSAFSLGVRAVVPGFLALVALACLRILPHRLVIPVVAFLLRPRGLEARDA